MWQANCPMQLSLQIDIETAKLSYHTPVHAMLGDAKATAEELLAGLIGADRRTCNPVAATISSGNVFAPATIITVLTRTSTKEFIDPRTLSKAVDAILPSDRVKPPTGHFAGGCRNTFACQVRAHALSHSFNRGLGLASTIGLAVANPAS